MIPSKIRHKALLLILLGGCGSSVDAPRADASAADLTSLDRGRACGCAEGQVCVVPDCYRGGDLCFPAGPSHCPSGWEPAARDACPPTDPPQTLCRGACPAAASFCLDLPAGCRGTPTCGCLAEDPCASVNGGECRDDHITPEQIRCWVYLND